MGQIKFLDIISIAGDFVPITKVLFSYLTLRNIHRMSKQDYKSHVMPALSTLKLSDTFSETRDQLD